jgi:hypothetical protein
MAIRNILATIECDGCGREFRVSIPTDLEVKDYETVFDIAEDMVSDGLVHDYPKEKRSNDIPGFCSYQGGKHLCGSCTKIVDAALPEGLVTDEQVALALNPPHEEEPTFSLTTKRDKVVEEYALLGWTVERELDKGAMLIRFEIQNNEAVKVTSFRTVSLDGNVRPASSF